MDRRCEKRSDEAIQESPDPYALWIAASAFGLLARDDDSNSNANPLLVEHPSEDRLRYTQNPN